MLDFILSFFFFFLTMLYIPKNMEFFIAVFLFCFILGSFVVFVFVFFLDATHPALHLICFISLGTL